MRTALYLSTALLLTGCFASDDTARVSLNPPAAWTSQTQGIKQTDTAQLKEWWKGFNDPTLNALVDKALAESPDRGLAKARLQEARGLKRAAQGGLFPQIGLSAEGGRDNRAASNVGDFYEAGFDATYELDIFGRNRSSNNAAEAAVSASEASYDNASLSLVAEVARTYVELRSAQKQAVIARKNLEAQEKTLELVTHQKELGEAPQLDVERSQGLVNTTKATIPEFARLADNARLRLTVLTGSLPQDVLKLLETSPPLPQLIIQPVLLTPVQIMQARPDIRAAAANLLAQTSLADAAVADLFPTITLGAFFGLQDTALIDPTRLWSAGISAAVTLLDFGRIRGQIDAADARELQAYELWRKTVLQAVTDVETALTDYAHIQKRRGFLDKALQNAEQSLSLSEQLYKEGEVSFLDVLDAQRTANDANAALVAVEAAQTQSLIALYKSLGVY